MISHVLGHPLRDVMQYYPVTMDCMRAVVPDLPDMRLPQAARLTIHALKNGDISLMYQYEDVAENEPRTEPLWDLLTCLLTRPMTAVYMYKKRNARDMSYKEWCNATDEEYDFYRDILRAYPLPAADEDDRQCIPRLISLADLPENTDGLDEVGRLCALKAADLEQQVRAMYPIPELIGWLDRHPLHPADAANTAAWLGSMWLRNDQLQETVTHVIIPLAIIGGEPVPGDVPPDK